MYVITDLSEVPSDVAPSAITIGKFDGLHHGHLWVVSQLHDEARARGLNPVVVTFDRHPAAVLAPETAPPPIVSTRQKLDLLRRQGLAATIVVPFTPEFARLSPREFVERLLVKQLGVKLLLVGRDFRFGKGGEGDVEFLRGHAAEFGYELIVTRDEQGPGDRRASSTWVRELLEVGDVRTVTEVLGRYHVLAGEIVHGAKRGREIGFPTANLSPDLEGLIPGDGVYAGWFHDGDAVYPTAVSIGNNPTFDGVPQKQVEAYVIGENLDLYGRRVQIALVERLRSMVKFEGIGPLKAQLERDVETTKRILGIA
ncbi:riboflavin biosynthesis protein [Pseudoclavibacter endophyticus]|uniref:Riboflavin biosynthesis protein n=1 Tax=Pseudoclavibacter endophyticus TaxID=1778590 RepID=A0A6H9WP82_9MICO|nr:bifunctional riboflavin kinase/FAD synthetase [Pseudoclavibacter endophyticus]KAB1649918.1 bifunctional riboflavin kinase/FAD synthetase [Pseudoclavibacter endophyticus]GGA58733.1 riboflavin biosynthesis protein [Pseudoclavibacter endophyticus]